MLVPETSAQKYGPDPSELRALERLAMEQSSDKRRQLMSRLTDILDVEVDAYPSETVKLLGDTLITLLDQIDEPGRIELSERVAPKQTTPHGLAKRLAQDSSVQVAEPVLAQSPVLNDDDLVEIATQQSEGHLMAMTRRDRLSAQVTDAIIDNGTSPVFHAVASNSGAEISENGFVRLSEEAPNHAGLAEALSRRTDIPEAVVDRVIDSLPPDYRHRLDVLWTNDVARGQSLVEQAAQEISQARLAHRRSMLEAKVAVKAIGDGSRSLEAAILGFAGSNRLGETAHVLAAIAKLPEEFVRAALFRRDGTAIALVARSINLKDEAFEEITRMRCTQLKLDASDGHKLLQAYRLMDMDGARRTVQFAAARFAAGDREQDRRGGGDTRSEQERHRVGERRSGIDRRKDPAAWSQ